MVQLMAGDLEILGSLLATANTRHLFNIKQLLTEIFPGVKKGADSPALYISNSQRKGKEKEFIEKG